MTFSKIFILFGFNICHSFWVHNGWMVYVSIYCWNQSLKLCYGQLKIVQHNFLYNSHYFYKLNKKIVDWETYVPTCNKITNLTQILISSSAKAWYHSYWSKLKLHKVTEKKKSHAHYNAYTAILCFAFSRSGYSLFHTLFKKINYFFLQIFPTFNSINVTLQNIISILQLLSLIFPLTNCSKILFKNILRTLFLNKSFNI